ncbi:acetyl-CoA carboxylase [Aureococcus anophagefferens]|nr:acetyl-CoA carboxylase [Aureococcus anophagefferens]
MVGIVNKKKMPLSPQGMEMKAKMVSYVEAHGGHRPVHTILIANNGMAATKAMISIARDLDANAEFVRLADRVVEVPSGSNKNNYANVELIIDIAVRVRRRVWPGWGHASENPELPDGLAARGIVFIGPDGGPMRALGDKIAASILAQTPRCRRSWSGDGLTVDPKVVAATGAIPPDLFRKAMVTTEDECLKAAARIGYPVMLKARGRRRKGIRMSHSEDELKSNFVQRRFQKIFEEAPAAIAKPEVFREMEKAAMRLTQSIGYSARARSSRAPCTEGITFINMPATQLQVAMGIPSTASRTSAASTVTNHIIAARITAENPDEGFKPTSGSIHRVKFQSTKNVWGFSVGANGGIHEFADSQFGHLFASGATREIARRHLVLALKSVEIRGVIRNPVEYLLSTATVKDLVRFPSVITYEGLYDFSIAKSGPETFALQINGQTVTAKVREQPDGTLLAAFGGATRKVFGAEEPLGLRIICDGVTCLMPTIFDPSECRTDVTGKIVRYCVRYLQDDGAQVNAGEPYVEVEAMKMIMALKTAESGAIKHEMSPGSIISTGDLLASLTLSDPSSVVKIEPFTGTFDVIDAIDEDLTAKEACALVLQGYECDDVKGLASELFDENPNIARGRRGLAALPGDKYSDLALLALRVSLAASDDEPTTPRTLDTKLFNKSKLTKGYALMELETGTPFGTAFLGNKTVESSALTKPGRGGEPPVVFLLYACQSDFGGGVAKVQEALETASRPWPSRARTARCP